MKWCNVAGNRNALVKQVAPNANHRPITRYEPFRSVPKQCTHVCAHCMQNNPEVKQLPALIKVFAEHLQEIWGSVAQ